MGISHQRAADNRRRNAIVAALLLPVVAVWLALLDREVGSVPRTLSVLVALASVVPAVHASMKIRSVGRAFLLAFVNFVLLLAWLVLWFTTAVLGLEESYI